MIRIGRHEFAVEKTKFRGYLSFGDDGWTIRWFIEIEAQPRDVEDTSWAPKLKCHVPLAYLPHPRDLPGTELGPLTADEYGETNFLLYCFEHEPVNNAALHFKQRTGTSYDFELRGTTPSWDDASPGAALLFIKCPLTFDGVVVDEFHESKARERLSEALGASGWEHVGVDQHRHVYQWVV